MKVERMIEIDAILDRVLDGKPVDHSSLSQRERELIDRLLEASGANMPGLDSPCGDHEAFASGLATQLSIGDEVTPGMRIGAFKLLERIGSGGMGVVFLAERADGEFDQRVALKLLGGTDHDPTLFQLFQRERALLAQLEHSNIARLIDGGATEHHRPWFAMEYVDGKPLHHYANHHELSIKARIRLFLQACDALDHAHRQLILHRDIKPANLLVSDDGVLRVVDFGLGRVFDPEDRADAETTIGAGRMTPGYASPEQARDDPIGIASEVYQLGLVLHVLLTDQLPYEVEPGSAYEVARTITEASIQRPSERWRNTGSVDAASDSFGDRPDRIRRALRGDLDNIVLTALARDPQARYASVAALAEDLCRHLDRLPIKARAATRRYRLARFIQRHKPAVAGFAAFVSLLLASVIALGLLASQLAAERDRATAESQRAQTETGKARQVRDYLISLFEEASPLNDGGRDISAYDLLQKGTQAIEALDSTPRIQAEMMLALALANRNLLDFDQAARLLDQALIKLEGSSDASSAAIAEVLMWRGRTAQQQNAFQLAEDALTRATRMLAEEPEHPALYAESLRNLAITRANKREFDRAESLFNQSLDIYADLPGHVSERYWVINDLAAFYIFTGQPDKARPLFEELVEYRTDTLGQAHPETLHAQGNLAAAAMALERLEQARPIYERLEDEYLDLYGADSPQLGQVRYRLGRIALEQGRLDRSSELLADARRTQLLNRGPDDANLATIISWQAAAAERQGNLDLAVTHLQDSLAIYDRIRQGPHPSKLELRISLGETLDRLQRRDESFQAYAQAVPSLEQFGNQFGLKTAEGLMELARHSLEANEIARANQALEQAARAAASAEQSDSSDRLIRQINQMMASIE